MPATIKNTSNNANTRSQGGMPLPSLASSMQAVAAIEREVSNRFIERDAEVRMVLLSLITRQHCLLLGARGEGKSAVVDAILKRIGGATYFKDQVWKTTSADEILGLPNPKAFRDSGTFERMTAGMLPEADVAFVDEIFKSNSTLMNAFLRLMNEREFRVGGRTVIAPLNSMVGASNEMPQSDDLGAFWDRFLLRTWITPLSVAGRKQFTGDELMRRQARSQGADVSGQTGATMTMADLAVLQTAALRVDIPETVQAAYEQIEQELDLRGYARPSTRRLGWLWDVVAGSALLNGRTTVIEDDLLPLKLVLWEDRSQIPEINAIVPMIAAPTIFKAQRIYDGIVQEIEQALIFGRKAQIQSNDEAANRAASNTFSQKLVETNPKIQRAVNDLTSALHEAKGAGRNTLEIECMGQDVVAKHRELLKLAGFVGPQF
jgi:MoxR-like ATPase